MLRNTFFIIAITVFSASTQTINLQGVVSNTGGTPISNAIVSLVRQDMKDTTGDDGKYSFISTSLKNLPSIVPHSNDISLKNNVLQFTLSTQSPMKLEIFDLKGNLLRQEINMNAAAGIYRFDISRNCQAVKVLVIKAAIGRSEVSFHYMAFKGGQYALKSLNTTSAISSNSGLTKIAAVVDTIKVTASGFQAKSVEITSLNNQHQDITLDSNQPMTRNGPQPIPLPRVRSRWQPTRTWGPWRELFQIQSMGTNSSASTCTVPKTLRPAGTSTPSLYGRMGTQTTPSRIPHYVSPMQPPISGVDSICP